MHQIMKTICSVNNELNGNGDIEINVINIGLGGDQFEYLIIGGSS